MTLVVFRGVGVGRFEVRGPIMQEPEHLSTALKSEPDKDTD